MKRVSLTVIAIWTTLASTCQVLTPNQLKEKESALAANRKTDSKQIGLLLELSAHYLFKQGEAKDDLTHSLNYAQQAKKISRALNDHKGYADAVVLYGTASMEGGDLMSAANALKDVTGDARSKLSLAYSRYYRFGGVNPINIDSAFSYANQAKNLAVATGNPVLETESLNELFALHLIRSDYNSAEPVLARISVLAKLTGANPHQTYSYLGEIHNNLGNFDKALYYSVEALKLLDQTDDQKKLEGRYLLNLASVYRNTGRFEAAFQHYELAYDYYKKEKPDNWWRMWLRERSTNALLKMGKNQQALALINKTLAEDPPAGNEQRSFILHALGNCYKSLGNFGEAEKNYLQALEASKKMPGFDAPLHQKVGQFYVETGQYNKARPYLEDVLNKEPAMGAAPKAHLYFLLFRVDSAAGNYISAINYLMQNKALDDSMVQGSKVRQVEELQIKYETEKKEQALQLQEKNIQLLTSQSEIRQRDLNQAQLELLLETQANDQRTALARVAAEKKDKDILLKEQNISYLKKETQLKQASLAVANKVKNLTLAGIILSIVIILLLYNQFRINQKKNKEISKKNISLERLITEREWLLKEVHHRVKNNLQTIMSLLETHSSYLKDDALLAIQNSKHRVFAMSLIHQKLYRIENSSTIDLAIYLPELIHYLADSYDVKNRIQIRQHIENIELDVSQAIPIGLIFNEAISNSLKYAFPDNRKGEINIKTVRDNEQLIRIVIKDNGIGLPDDWKKRKENSLGLKLMKGLSEDIRATFDVRSDNGTIVQLEFRKIDLQKDQIS
ncbi:MAG: tetratricopeptide repeat protein [Chitinophagaceae bacterium]|nr:tetratricopeptide repeat protein [Chitinophagaceae bacterium]